MKRYFLSAFLVFACPFVALAQSNPPDLKGKTPAQLLSELLPGMSSRDLNERKIAQQKWQEICTIAGADGNETLRLEVCTAMVPRITDKTSKTAKLWLLTQMEHIGKDECVESLTKLVDDFDRTVQESAIRALANNTGKKATAALISKLDSANSETKVGLINALGFRKDPSAVTAIDEELTSKNSDVAVAAANALGRIDSTKAVEALQSADAKPSSKLRIAVENALLSQADRMLTAKKMEAASKIYQRLHDKSELSSVRLAALRGTIQSAGNDADKPELAALTGKDPAVRAIAVGLLTTIPDAVVQKVVDKFDTLPVDSKVLALAAIADRKDRKYCGLALAAIKDSDANLKRAGMQALGQLGDASTVEFLVDAVAKKDSLSGVAAQSLAMLSANGIDEKLVSSLSSEKNPERTVFLMEILERRKSAIAVPAILNALGSPNASIRAAGFWALKALATPAEIPSMLASLTKLAKGPDREQAEQAIVTVCKQIADPERRADAILSVIGKDKSQTADLLPLLGRVGGSDAITLFRDILSNGDDNTKSVARRSLQNWPDTAANTDLLNAAREAKEPDRLAYIQALVRINTLPGERSNEDRLASLKVLVSAMKLATRDDERKAILEGVGFIRTMDTFKFVLPYLDQEALAQSACKAVVELAHSKNLREPNKAAFNPVLDRVIAICKDQNLVNRAKNYKEGR